MTSDVHGGISSLAQVFEPGTTYFYGRPAGLDSNFYNRCPPHNEELVAARALVCAGAHVNVVVFADTASGAIWQLLHDELGVPLSAPSRLIVLPSVIDGSIQGAQRNRCIKRALLEQVEDHTLVMAQPYLDDRLRSKFRIPPSVTAFLNDKKNIAELVPPSFRIPQLAKAASGAQFAKLDPTRLEYPCVVKVSSSSDGDGVRICRSVRDLACAQKAFADLDCPILIQRYIEAVFEIDLEFAIHFHELEACELVGYSHQLTGSNGEWIGAVIHDERKLRPLVNEIYEVLAARILPALRLRGWFGVGGVDVLIDAKGRFYFSDFNCRMTGATAQTLQSNAGCLRDRSILVCNASYEGTLDAFRARFKALAGTGELSQILNVVALRADAAGVQLHCGVLFDQDGASLSENIARLQALGLRSDAFAHRRCAEMSRARFAPRRELSGVAA